MDRDETKMSEHSSRTVSTNQLGAALHNFVAGPREDILARWEGRLAEWEELNVQVDGKSIARLVLDDLRSIAMAHELTPLSLIAAAQESGYSPTHLGREVKAGRIPNAGRFNAPKILRRDLPKKPSRLRAAYFPSRRMCRT